MRMIPSVEEDKEAREETWKRYLISSRYLCIYQKEHFAKVIDKETWNEVEISSDLFNILKKCDGRLHKFYPEELEIINILIKQGIVTYADEVSKDFNQHQIKESKDILPRPIEGAIAHVTGRCNLNCKHCYFSPHRTSEELSTEEWKKVFEQLYEMGVYKVEITGGEPLIRKDIIQICETLKEYEFLTTIITNATLLDEHFLENLVDSGVSAFGVSLDCATPKTFTDFRGEDYFFKVINNLKMIRDYRDSGKLSYFCVSTMLTRKTAKELFDLYQILKSEIKPDTWVIERPYASGNYKKYIAEYDIPVVESAPILHKLLLQIRRDKPNFPYRIHLDKYYTYLNPERYSHIDFSKVYAPYSVEDWACGRHFQHLYILPNGDIVWCDYKEVCPNPIGNVRNESISEIWRKSEEIKKGMKLKNFVCKNCKYVRYCGGGCRFIPITRGEGIQGCDRDFRYYIEYGIKKGLYENGKNF